MAAQAAAAACPLLILSDDVLEVVGHQISDALHPAVAGALAACNHNLWRVMRAPLAMLQTRHAEARALAAKVGWSCAMLRVATGLHWYLKHLDAADMATLAMLFSMGALARVVLLDLDGNRFGPTGGSALLSGLACGNAPQLIHLDLIGNDLGTTGASALAGALSRGALPKLEKLFIAGNMIGDEGLAALAGPLRQHLALRFLYLHRNLIGDAGVAALLDNLGAKELKQLEVLDIASNQVGDAGCGALITALDGTTLPLLRHIGHDDNQATPAALQAVHDALQANVVNWYADAALI